MKPRTIIIAAAMIAAVTAGIWLFVSPALEKREALDRQEELLDGIAADIGEIAGDEAVTKPEATEPEAIFSDEAEPVETAVPTEPDVIPAEDERLSAVEPAYEPLDDSEFPETVIGIGILTIEKIDLRLPVAEGISESGLKIAPGRVPQTGEVGKSGNAVIAGHRNYAYGEMFNRLDEVENGDIIGYQARNGETMEFEVFEVITINPDDQIAFIQPANESIITLYTCTPVRAATHRLLVRAKKIQGGL